MYKIQGFGNDLPQWIGGMGVVLSPKGVPVVVDIVDGGWLHTYRPTAHRDSTSCAARYAATTCWLFNPVLGYVNVYNDKLGHNQAVWVAAQSPDTISERYSRTLQLSNLVTNVAGSWGVRCDMSLVLDQLALPVCERYMSADDAFRLLHSAPAGASVALTRYLALLRNNSESLSVLYRNRRVGRWEKDDGLLMEKEGTLSARIAKVIGV